jgi:UPF0271 protein
MLSIDLNCDMGEGMANDAAIMPFISSVNIACGAHAGDAETMQRTIELALQHNIAIGAHPGFADKKNFGRTEQKLSDKDYYELVSEQLATLKEYIDVAGAIMHHVKPHGALYNMSAKNNELAAIIATAAYDHDPSLVLYGLSNSYSIYVAKKMGLKTASEVFADRNYMDDGSLVSRTNSHALITNETNAVQQVLQMVKMQTVTSINGKKVNVVADTVCIHGDTALAPAFARLIATQLKANNISIQPV